MVKSITMNLLQTLLTSLARPEPKPADEYKKPNIYYVAGRSSNQIHDWARRNHVEWQNIQRVLMPEHLRGIQGIDLYVLPGTSVEIIEMAKTRRLNSINFGNIIRK